MWKLRDRVSAFIEIGLPFPIRLWEFQNNSQLAACRDKVRQAATLKGCISLAERENEDLEKENRWN